MNFISKILSISFSIRFIILSIGVLLIAVEKEFDGFIYDKLGINTPTYIDGELYPYYDKFLLLERINGRYSAKRGLIMLISDDFKPEERTVGYCIIKTYPNKLIVMNRKFWDKYNETQREISILHEIAHCVYRQNHRDNSIMQASILDYNEYIKNYYYYITELFSH